MDTQTATPPRTQEDRRAATQQALLGATIDCLVEYGYAGRVIAAIFEALETVEQDRGSGAMAGIPNNTTHGESLLGRYAFPVSPIEGRPGGHVS